MEAFRQFEDCHPDGILTLYEAKTGRQLEKVRAGATGSVFSASPVAADGKIYLASEDGNVFVLKAGPAYELIATNPMGEVCMASPAISEGMIFLRTLHHLYGIAE